MAAPSPGEAQAGDRVERSQAARTTFLVPLTEVAYMTQHIAQERLPTVAENPRRATDAYARRQENWARPFDLSLV